MIPLILVFSFIRFGVLAQVVVERLVGESVTVSCSFTVYPTYPIYWYHEGDKYFISENDRLSINCQRDIYESTPDTCQLTIANLTVTDSGFYRCEYFNDAHNTGYNFGRVKLNVGYGNLPSDDSPICKTVTDKIGGGYVEVNEYSIGNEIYLRCLYKEEASIYPSFVWKREKEANTTILADRLEGKSLQTPLITLVDKDVGAVFTCFMTHPGLPEIRNCSITPLPAPPTTPKSSTQAPILVSRLSEYITTTEKEKFGKAVTDSNTSVNSQSFVLPIITAIIVLIVATVVVVLTIILIKRRRKPNINPSKPTYDLSYDQDRSTAAEYAVVNTPDSIDKANKLKVAKKNQQESTIPAFCNSTGTTDTRDEEDACPLYAKPDDRKISNDVSVENDDSNISTTAAYAAVNAPDFVHKLKNTNGYPPDDSNVTDCDSSGTAYEEDACPLYAQPEKRKKSNDLSAGIVEEHNQYDNSLSQQPSDQPAGTADDDGLMYADLDLTRAPDSDSARMPPTDPDATVYADIKRSL